MFTINSQKPETRQGNGRGGMIPDRIPLKAWDTCVGLYPKVKAQGKLSLALNPSNGEAFVIGDKTYTFQTTLTNNDGNIKIGGTLAETKANVVAAINLTGQPGTQYALATRVNEKVTIADFVVNDAIITAKEAGTAGNSIATTETMAGAGNQFDAATLGTYRAGADYTDVDFTYAIWTDMSRTRDNSGSSADYARPNFSPSYAYHDYYYQSKKHIDPFWSASGFKKIVVPDSFANKIKRVENLGMCVASKINEVLSTTTGHANNSVYKIIEISASKGVVQYLDGTASQVYLMAFTIDANGAITGGTPVSMNSMNNTELECDICAIDTDKFLVSYKDTGATNYPKCAVGTVSGTAITMASGVQPVATATTSSKLTKIGTNKAVLAFNAESLYAVSISVTTPSYGSVATLTGATSPMVVQNGTDKFQVIYTKSSANYTVACTVATLAITIGTELRLTNGNIGGGTKRYAIVKVDTDKFAYFTDEQDSMYAIDCNAHFLTVSGTVTSVAHSSYIGRTADADIYAQLIDTTKILFYTDNGNDGAVIDVDLVNNRLTSRCALELHDYFTHSDNNRKNGMGYIGTGNVRFIKLGNFVVVMSRQGDPRTQLQYFSFPVSLSIEVYLNDEYVKTVVFDEPSLYAPLKLNLDVNDYGAVIKLKNPNATQMYIYPETEGRCGSMILE